MKCLQANTDALRKWWCIESNKLGELAADISSSSDRVNLPSNSTSVGDKLEIRHPISGQSKEIEVTSNINLIALIPKHICEEIDVEILTDWKKEVLDFFKAHKVIESNNISVSSGAVSKVIKTLDIANPKIPLTSSAIALFPLFLHTVATG